uniref:non-specific serine/threonine protein kinase n=1 Tax=Sinocyclocheilus anshuiensis TaxID=1608454 RepID=A0A671KTB7_9TELE
MESVGKFEFNRKDLIGHGAFAVVFKGRHKKKHDFEVAVKCINKKNLAKSQSLLGKEIRILKSLFCVDCALTVFVCLLLQYCNGGDLAEYLHSKGSLNEDTIRVLLQQLAGAMSVLRSKGIIHRDLKPQNILLSYSTRRRSNPNNICIKLADFGFARYLQGNTMAATLCGSPMYMAPEVIMSQNYDAKADLWSVGTIIYQCLTGKAPFQASTPQELRQFYERHRSLSPSIPRETSSHLRHLLLGLLQRNHGERMDFDEFFHHPFLEASTSMKKCKIVMCMTLIMLICYSFGYSNISVPLPQTNPTPSPDSLLKDSSSSESDYFVMVPAQFTSKMINVTGESVNSRDESNSQITREQMYVCAHDMSIIHPSLSLSLALSRPLESCVSSYAQSVPVPVPTQKLNYQRMEQNLQVSDRLGLLAVFMGHLCCRSLSTGRLSDKLLKAVFGHQFDRGSCESLNSEKPMDTTAPPGGSDGTEQGSGSPAGVVFIQGSPEYGHTPPHATRPRRFSVLCLHVTVSVRLTMHFQFTSFAYSSPDSLRYGYTDAMATNLCEGVAFVPPELPEEMLMEEGHTDLLSQLRFILAFSHCITEIARTKDSGIERNMALDASFLEQSVVADQVSLLSREWSSAEQLVLYMKCAELLSSALHTAMAEIKEGKLFPSGSVKQVVRKLNEMYKKSVNSCRSLTEKLQLFISSKQRLMDRINSITAERLIYTHTIQMVQTAALDEMFHHGETSVERYHKALLLMEGLSLIITETADLNSISKCRQCIEWRLSSLQPKGCV